MKFETKKEVLEFYGKDGKNVRALERMIEKGMVVYRDGWYITKWDRERDVFEGYQRKYDLIKEMLGEVEWKLEDMVVLFYRWYKDEMTKTNRVWEIITLDQFREKVWKQVWYEPKVNKILKGEWEVVKKEEDRGNIYERETKIGVADDWKGDN